MKWIVLSPIMMLAACGGGNDAPGGVTAGENKALDEAAEMLEQRQLNPSAIPPVPQRQDAPAPAASRQAN